MKVGIDTGRGNLSSSGFSINVDDLIVNPGDAVGVELRQLSLDGPSLQHLPIPTASYNKSNLANPVELSGLCNHNSSATYYQPKTGFKYRRV